MFEWFILTSPHVHKLVQVKQQPGKAFQSRRIVLDVSKRAILFQLGGTTAESDSISQVYGRGDILSALLLQPAGKFRGGRFNLVAIHQEQALWRSDGLRSQRTGESPIIHVE